MGPFENETRNNKESIKNIDTVNNLDQPCNHDMFHCHSAPTSEDYIQGKSSYIDLLPTFADLAGAKIPDDRIIDGKNIWPIISGEKGARSPHDIYYYYKGNRLESARQGKWKVRRSGKKSQSVELYDLDNDIAESKNLSQKNPELIQTILKKMDKFDKDLKLSQRPIGKQ